ncbi:penicillin-binding protein [Pseudoalteromonas porphyrae]|uniref:serine hydrolase domain-containing protein n=1 Tax=Pseudoalteromonas TaxID=53246 RepID=UPI0006BA72F8|nr:MULTISPECIES: serine hydrolase domain-containing protein [Pseudoalteromonas]KPH92777.1 penicillin-binding protein [Pseudoalteromonas porphyrae]
MNHHVDHKIEAFVKKTKRPQLNVAIWDDGTQSHASYGFNKNINVDVFEIGSVGKTFTATLLAILARNGVVDIDDRVGKYCPNLPIVKDITLKQLVTHTSGLPSDPIKEINLSYSKFMSSVLSFNKSQIDDFLNAIKKPLKTGKFKYSNLGMALLGNILAECQGTTYEETVKKHLLDPLGMADTHVSGKAYNAQRLAKGHSASGKELPDFKWDGMEPAGVWRSTTNDMLQFLKAHLGCFGNDWKALLQETTSPVFNEAKMESIGFAWALGESQELGEIAWHNGGTFGQHSIVVCCRDKNMAIVILTNKVPKLWHSFFSGYSLESLSTGILKLLVTNKESIE